MAITTKSQLIAAMGGGQELLFNKNGVASTSSPAYSTLIDQGVNPPAGVLAGTSTTAGVVPDDTTAGFPSINGFGAGNTGYLASVRFIGTSISQLTPARCQIVDLLFKAGAYAFNASVTLSAQPSYSARIPGGDYKGTQIWMEAVTTFTGVPSVTVTYTNQDGVTGQTARCSAAVNSIRTIKPLILQAGDSGVQKIESVACTVATAGTFNILVVRPLFQFAYDTVNRELFYGPDAVGLPIVYDTSAIYPVLTNTTTNSAIPGFESNLLIVQG